MPANVKAGTSIGMLGCFNLVADRVPVRLPLQTQRMVAYLVVNGAPIDRQDLAGRLWPFTRQVRAQSNLRTALWRIRRDAPDVVRADRSTIDVSPEVSVDYRDLLDGATAWDNLPPSELIIPLRNDLLPGWDEEWLTIERERVRQMRARRLEELSRRCTDVGDIDNAISAAYAAILIEPLRESARLALMEAHVTDGNCAEAMRQLLLTLELLENELGLAPSAMFRRRVQEMELPALDSSRQLVEAARSLSGPRAHRRRELSGRPLRHPERATSPPRPI